ncbi:Glyco transf 43 domain containing protein [Asbolus verrucosus]|uniref:Galactosylgalactosylxylosylprotein 3-beta-glucuronosyltransferase n=1 Tax=Asbolus verrucosus TaxID=1661398 RepID=A0A482VSL6_ASBVE|nr:Glyco transf 43 domain containing protein [Asbolus verrucosus]
MPEEYRKEQFPPKGVSNRNKGLEWIRKNARSGVIYFADDDNTYDLELFEEIRHTKRVSMFPVGLMPHLGVCTPVVEKGKLINFYCGWIGDRKFPIDMAGFAVSVEFLLTRPRAWVPFLAGYEETGFLVSLQPFEIPDIELLASNCTKILVWHTQTKENDEPAPVDLDTYGHTNLAKLGEIMM